ncbi:MAG: hypothetical protein LBC40_02790 [Dysgonamonadaceae bacterium]|jgi:hypothetical protein|nr:hypothetical protein [Dysgonamonadaceae bacterium]
MKRRTIKTALFVLALITPVLAASDDKKGSVLYIMPVQIPAVNAEKDLLPVGEALAATLTANSAPPSSFTPTWDVSEKPLLFVDHTEGGEGGHPSRVIIPDCLWILLAGCLMYGFIMWKRD